MCRRLAHAKSIGSAGQPWATSCSTTPAASRPMPRREMRTSLTSTFVASPLLPFSARRRDCRCSSMACASTSPFGDVVNWDLIPRAAIARVDLMPGLEPGIRPQHPRRRAVDPDQGRPSVPRRIDRGVRRIVRSKRSQFRDGRCARSLGWFSDGNLCVGQRMGRSQLEHCQATVRQGRLAGCAHECRSQPQLCRQHARRKPDDSTLVPRRLPPGVHVSRSQYQQGRRLESGRAARDFRTSEPGWQCLLPQLPQHQRQQQRQRRVRNGR